MLYLHTQLSAAVFIKFLAFPMWRLFESGFYFKIMFLNHGIGHCKNLEERA